MKKLVLVTLVCLLIGVSGPLMAQQSPQKIILQGGVSTSIPKTPTEVKAYLINMKKIMKEYEALGNKLMPVMMLGNNNKNVASTARNEWIRLARKIQLLTPPSELKAAHNTLAASLNRSSKFLIVMASTQAEQKQQILSALIPVVNDLQQSTNAYSTNCSVVIANYGLDPSLNPMGTDGSISNNSMAGLGGLGGLNMSGLNNLGALQSLMGSGGAASMLQGIDLNNLNINVGQ